jgi:hypothetical protein
MKYSLRWSLKKIERLKKTKQNAQLRRHKKLYFNF